MRKLVSDGQVSLNAEGKQYTASFHLGVGVITVTSGSVSRVTLVGGTVVSPESVARTILKRMIRESLKDADYKHPTLDHRVSANGR
jgi:hypothetical protein